MKKMITSVCLSLLMLMFAWPAQAAERKLTLMIYMCGSNLESSYGSASADIQEMLAAAPGLDGASVLIMTGGSTSWSTGYDPSQIQISEVGQRGMRVVWHSNAMNMGEPDTLTSLLTFGAEKYPAEEYALIIWNHGGGPLEGVCWDELFSMDKLSLAELTGAISAAQLPENLSWIGFDACLMSSIEVAAALSPYADYMIASQETEPAFGWNYAFLNGLGADASSAETGRRIVDAYFDVHGEMQDVLTLACLDLSKAADVQAAIANCFSSSGEMNHALYNALSGARMNTAGFGKGLKSFDDAGYDLVDLADLADRLSPLLPDTASLQSALDGFVCYNRANIEGANGVSIYHPYTNKDKFLSQWQSSYAALDFSDEYSTYISQFGAWLTGASLADWSGLIPQSHGFNSDGHEELTLQLSESQASEFASAQLIILKQFALSSNTYSLVGMAPTSMDGNGLLTSTAHWYNLYVQDGAGEYGGPMSYMLSPDGTRMICLADMINYSNGASLDTLPVLYYLEPPTGSEDVSIAQIRVYDEATETYTNRISLNAADYDTMFFMDTQRIMPESDGVSELPDFYAWTPDADAFSAFSIDPALGWRFLWRDALITDDDLIALFCITDTQQNTYCSQPIRLQNSDRIPFTATETISGEDFTAELSGYVSVSESEPGLRIEITAENLTDQSIKLSFASITLNHSRYMTDSQTDYSHSCTVASQSSGTAYAIIGVDQLLGLPDISSITVEMNYYPDAASYTSSIVTLTFPVEHCSVEAILPDYSILAQAEGDGFTWQLMNISPDEVSGFDMLFIAENHTASDFSAQSQFLINGIGCDASSFGYITIPAGKSIVKNVQIYNDLYTSSTFSVTGSSISLYGHMLSRHILQGYGFSAINEITLLLDLSSYQRTIGYSFTLPLETPYVIPDVYEPDAISYYTVNRLPDSEMLDLDRLLTLVDAPDASIQLERILVGEKSIALALHLTNKTEDVQVFSLGDVVISGAEYDQYPETYVVAPGATYVACPVFGADYFSDAALTSTFDSLSLVATISSTGESFPICFTAAESVPFATPGGAFVKPDDVSFSEQASIPAPTPVPVWEGPVSIFMENITLPEDANAYSRTFSTQLTPEQAAQASKALMLIVQEAENGNLNLVSYQPATLAEDGTLSATATGLVLCVESLPDVLIHGYQIPLEDGAISYSNAMTLIATGAVDYEYFFNVVKNLTLVYDPVANTASITDVLLSDPLPESQQSLQILKLPTYELECTLADTSLPYVGEITRNNSDAWYDSFPVISMGNYPVQLALRPITAQDQFYVMFSVQNADGTGYTLPPIPFMQEE